ncbi:MAG TPA: hypothetical protein VEJ36_05975 [Nitrososphaerales archaeon]|nr:hypothetical protein [Nitrososphaerales archaeon]
MISRPNPCEPLGGAKEEKSTVTSTTFGAVTEWSLPNPARWPNSLTVAPDGSIWFGEQSVPGVGHLFPNGSLVEYAWPWSGTQDTLQGCGYKTGIWGIVLWNGMVWASSFDSNQIIGLDPASDSTVVLGANSPGNLTIGPDGALWFTEQTFNHAVIGRISQGLDVSTYKLLNYTEYIPQEISFVNSSYAYFVALNPTKNYVSGLFSFDPDNVSGGIEPTLVSSGVDLVATTSISEGDNVLWIAQHEISQLTGYNITTGTFTEYPTSVDNFTSQSTTLPYFVSANGSEVWFSEHYANQIALLNVKQDSLTEYSEANPPVYNLSLIGNDETIGQSKSGLWFASISSNYLGYVNASYSPGYTVSVVGGDSVSLRAGANATLQFVVNGTWSNPLRVQYSDSEDATSVPAKVSISPSVQQFNAGHGPVTFTVRIAVESDITPGEYTILITLNGGLISRSTYLFLTITG